MDLVVDLIVVCLGRLYVWGFVCLACLEGFACGGFDCGFWASLCGFGFVGLVLRFVVSLGCRLFAVFGFRWFAGCLLGIGVILRSLLFVFCFRVFYDYYFGFTLCLFFGVSGVGFSGFFSISRSDCDG